jgi:hypothetical protein
MAPPSKLPCPSKIPPRGGASEMRRAGIYSRRSTGKNRLMDKSNFRELSKNLSRISFSV